MKKYKSPVFIFKSIEEKILNLPEEDNFNWQEIFELFHRPAVKDFEIKFPEFNEEKIKKILVERHDFSLERIENQLKKLKEAKEKNKQKGLKKWF